MIEYKEYHLSMSKLAFLIALFNYSSRSIARIMKLHQLKMYLLKSFLNLNLKEWKHLRSTSERWRNLSIIFEDYRVPLNTVYVPKLDRSNELRNIRPGDEIKFSSSMMIEIELKSKKIS